MSRRKLLAEVQRAAPSEAWQADLGGQPRTLRTVGGLTMALRPTLERRARKGEPAVWSVEALARPQADDDPEAPLRVAYGRGDTLPAAMDDAATKLAARCKGGGAR